MQDICPFSTHLLINTSVDSWIPGYLFYTLGSSSTLFCYSTYASFDSWDLSRLAPVPS